MVISVSNLVKRYGALTALDHFSMQVQEGEIFGLLGPNGSGKTTAINCVLSLLSIDEGSISVFGKPMNPEAYDIKKNIGIVMQQVAVYEELTVLENIDYFCGLYVTDKKKRRQLVEEAIEFVEIGDFRRFFPKKLSGGLLRRLNIACGIAHKPKLIIMDEPTVAVDPQSRNKILEGIVELNRQGATILYTSHYMEEVEQICSRIMILDKGAVIASGTKEELKSKISLGETITVETQNITSEQLSHVYEMSGVTNVTYKDGLLIVKSAKGSYNLERILNFLNNKSIRFEKIHSVMPTLNDVFLEITGKELRD